MINLLICDDDELFLPIIKSKIDEFLGAYIEVRYYLYSNATEVLQDQNKFDLAIIDINMPKISGFELAQYIKEMNEDVKLIYISSEKDMVYQSFAYNVYDFICKESLLEISEKSKRWLADLSPKYYIHRHYNDELLIQLNTIIYVYKMINDCYIVVKNNKQYRERIKIEEFYNTLISIDNIFVMPNRSTFVNIQFITDIKGKNIILYNSQTVPVSKHLMKKVSSKIYDYKMRTRK